MSIERSWFVLEPGGGIGVVDVLRIEVTRNVVVSGLWDRPDAATACLVLAHGAGAGMAHPFMEAVARGLGERRIATLRFQFPYMEAGSSRPDSTAAARAACVRQSRLQAVSRPTYRCSRAASRSAAA